MRITKVYSVEQAMTRAFQVILFSIWTVVFTQINVTINASMVTKNHPSSNSQPENPSNHLFYFASKASKYMFYANYDLLMALYVAF